MRLTPDQIQAIRHAATATFGADTPVWVFGSRTDTRKKIKMLSLLERQLGERKIDLVIEQPGDSRPIVLVAHATGIQIQ